MGMKAKEMWKYMAENDFPKLERIRFIIIYRCKDFWVFLLRNLYKVYPYHHKHRWTSTFKCLICRKGAVDLDEESRKS